jgi:hypothetical protein
VVILLIAIRKQKGIKFKFVGSDVLFRWKEAIEGVCFGGDVDIDSSVVYIVSPT